MIGPLKIPKEIRSVGMVIRFLDNEELHATIDHRDDTHVYLTLDFGMPTCVTTVDNFLAENGDSEEDIILKTLQFDLVHAFCHPVEDPNYTHYHWALYGNLKNRVILEEAD